MKVTVLGAGAIGSMFGGLLKWHAPDLEVLLVTRGEHSQVIEERGSVRLQGPWGEEDVPIRCTSHVEEIAGSDLILFTVKSQSTEEMARAAQPYWGQATVVSIQNGINDHALTKVVAPDQLVMGMTATNMELVEPGTVSLQLGGATILGPPAEGQLTKRVDEAAQLLQRINRPELSFRVEPNVLGVRYHKLAINALGYASCLSASNFIAEAITHSQWRNEIGLPLVRECRALFQQANIELEPIPGVPSLTRLERLMRLMNLPLVGPVLAFGARRLFDRKPIVFSLLQDLKRRKPTEVDFVNGEIVRLAESVGRTAPNNRLVVEMVHELERRGDATFFTRDQVLERFSREK